MYKALICLGYEKLNQTPANNTDNYPATGSQPEHIPDSGMRCINTLQVTVPTWICKLKAGIKGGEAKKMAGTERQVSGGN